jgi:leucyl-tRNA synthetase
MELLNEVSQAKNDGVGTASPVWGNVRDVYLRMIAPIAPHIADELWERLGHQGSIHLETWPDVDEAAARDEEITLVVQVNGKLRDRLTLPVGLPEEEMRQRALASDGAKRFLEGLTVRKVVVVPGRLVNIVAT